MNWGANNAGAGRRWIPVELQKTTIAAAGPLPLMQTRVVAAFDGKAWASAGANVTSRTGTKASGNMTIQGYALADHALGPLPAPVTAK